MPTGFNVRGKPEVLSMRRRFAAKGRFALALLAGMLLGLAIPGGAAPFTPASRLAPRAAASQDLPALAGQGVDVNDTRLLSRPAISKTHIAFVYAGDLWVAGLDGKNVRRLTTDKGIDSSPAFSPDGALVAFSAEYDGNTDVYIVP